jgi:hypothetical protein
MTTKKFKELRPFLEYFYFCGVCYGRFEGMGANFEIKFNQFIETMNQCKKLKHDNLRS